MCKSTIRDGRSVNAAVQCSVHDHYIPKNSMTCLLVCCLLERENFEAQKIANNRLLLLMVNKSTQSSEQNTGVAPNSRPRYTLPGQRAWPKIKVYRSEIHFLLHNIVAELARYCK